MRMTKTITQTNPRIELDESMPPKSDYGLPTRRSQCLTTASEEPKKINQVDDQDKSMESDNPEEVNVITESTKPEDPTYLALSDNRE